MFGGLSLFICISCTSRPRRRGEQILSWALTHIRAKTYLIVNEPHLPRLTSAQTHAAASRLLKDEHVRDSAPTSEGNGALESRDVHSVGQKILIFFNNIGELEMISNVLAKEDYIHGAVHERMRDEERIGTLESFHDGVLRLMLTTDHLSRGVDFVGVDYVIQYEMAKDISSHLHRLVC